MPDSGPTLPWLSIVMPVLDEAVGIGAVLEPLQALRRQGVELVVSDGGSRDGTPALCEGRADRIVPAPRGRARQMNAGAAVARGAVLLFLHADTRLPDGALAILQSACAVDAARHPLGRWGRFDVRIDGRSRGLGLVARAMNLRSRLSGIATGDQAIFVGRRLFETVGGFPDQPLMEDIEISRRLRRLARPVCLRQRVLTSGRRWDRDGLWPTIRLMWRLRWLYWRGVEPGRLAAMYR